MHDKTTRDDLGETDQISAPQDVSLPARGAGLVQRSPAEVRGARRQMPPATFEKPASDPSGGDRRVRLSGRAVGETTAEPAGRVIRRAPIIRREGEGGSATATAPPKAPAPDLWNLLGGDFKLTSLAAALTTHGPVQPSALSDERLLRILISTFEQDWFKAKACLTADEWPSVVENKPPHAASISLMAAFVEMRARMWDKFAKSVQPMIIGEVMRVRNLSTDFADLSNPKQLGDNFGLKESVGSDSVTSDIDLSAAGQNTEIGLAMINREFPTYFGVTVEPGTLFDINVYSSDWMFGGKESVAGGVMTVKPTEEGSLSAENQQKKDEQNEEWSMVKIRRNMTIGEWKVYKNMLLAGLKDAGKKDQVKAMVKRFATTEAHYKAYRDDVEQRIKEMTAGVDHEEQQQASVFAGKGGHDHFEEEAIEMAARNRAYEEIALKIKALRLKIAKAMEGVKSGEAPPASIEVTLLELHSEIARGLTYANEVYATQGAVLHTVYGKQGAAKKLAKLQKTDKTITAVKYDLTKEMYLQSVNENVGDTLHSLNHNKHDPQYAVYRAGKYINRLCEAATALISAKEVAKIPPYRDLETIGLWSVKEKAGAAGKDPMAVRESSSYFSKFDASGAERVRSQAVELGAKAVATYKSTKSEDPQ